MCTLVETKDVTVLLDAGIALGPRFRLMPHPREFRARDEGGRESRKLPPALRLSPSHTIIMIIRLLISWITFGWAVAKNPSSESTREKSYLQKIVVERSIRRRGDAVGCFVKLRKS